MFVFNENVIFQEKGKNEQERKHVIKKERTEEMGPIKTEGKK